jgi:2-polyprenyl-6-methoxyphenol hydroxylase-like FAD-dependent oxidoreductase
MAGRLGEHAVVIGGSIAGLISARVLADYFERVTILERDHIEPRPAVHKSTPQGNHLHTVLMGGLRVLSDLYPGFSEKLHAMGAVPIRLTPGFSDLPSRRRGVFAHRRGQRAARLGHSTL